MSSPDMEMINKLNEAGITEQIQKLRTALRDKDLLLYDAVQIFEKNTIDDLVEYVITKFLDKFIPSYLVFYIQDYFHPEKINSICYTNMKRTDSPILVDSLKPYKKVFDLFSSSLTFEAFENLVDNKETTDIFNSINPEVIIPLMGKEGSYGFIVVSQKVVGDKYSEKELSYINQLMKFTSISLQNIINYSRATVDQKTKLYNHSYFTRRLSQELSRIKRYQTKIAVIMLDLDHFKKFNDTHGHLAGDILLEEVAATLMRSVRNEDVVARFGGEEFILMLVECDPDYAHETAERMRKSISEISIPYYGKNLSTTASMGLINISHESISDISEILRNVDSALYLSKEGGRNQCTVFANN